MFLTVNLRDGLIFAPVIEPEHEGALFTGRSHQMLEEGQFHDVPIIIGYTSLEALLPEIPGTLMVFSKDFARIICSYVFLLTNSPKSVIMVTQVISHYFKITIQIRTLHCDVIYLLFYI